MTMASTPPVVDVSTHQHELHVDVDDDRSNDDLTRQQKARNDHDKIEDNYRKALEINEGNVLTLINYGMFLQNIRKDYTKAEEMYKKVLQLDENNVDALNNYALLLQKVHKEYDKAEKINKIAESVLQKQMSALVHFGKPNIDEADSSTSLFTACTYLHVFK